MNDIRNNNNLSKRQWLCYRSKDSAKRGMSWAMQSIKITTPFIGAGFS